MVCSWELPQKLEVESPSGSNLGTMGLSFLAREERSSKVSMFRAVDLAPLKEEVVKAAAEPVRMEAMASFML